MVNPKVNYQVNKRARHKVNDEYEIVFDRCTPIINGVKQNYEQLLMRYTKNGDTIPKPPAFNELEMMKAIVKMYNDDSIISSEAKQILREGIK